MEQGKTKTYYSTEVKERVINAQSGELPAIAAELNIDINKLYHLRANIKTKMKKHGLVNAQIEPHNEFAVEKVKRAYTKSADSAKKVTYTINGTVLQFNQKVKSIVFDKDNIAVEL